MGSEVFWVLSRCGASARTPNNVWDGVLQKMCPGVDFMCTCAVATDGRLLPVLHHLCPHLPSHLPCRLTLCVSLLLGCCALQDERNAYIVQELCTGGSLHEHLASKGTYSEPEAANIMRGVLDLLVILHRRHICYGDLKPANIMFSGSLQVRAIDFGCSRSARGRALTQACGSPVYAAPEIAQQRFGVGVDVWSAGVLVSAQDEDGSVC